MRERVLGRFEWGGALRDEIGRLDALLTAALRHRERLLGDENDPRLLHPGRTALILMDDASVHDPVVLGGAVLLETGSPELATPDAGDAAAAAFAASVPRPATSGERLLEELVASAPAVRLVACVERLDLARHAHMLAGETLGDWIAEARAVYVPVAARTHPLIARRYEHWAGAREQRPRG